MRRKVLVLLILAFAISLRPASAEPLRVSSGVFLLDIEGDLFTFNGPGFALTTIGPDGRSPVQPDGLGIYSSKEFAARCGFCAEGALLDWSFRTTEGEQLLGRGNAVLDGVNAANVDFVGSMRFDAVPTPLSSGGALEFDFVAPFSFEAMIRGVQGGEELFARQFIGSGLVSAHYERGEDGLFVNDDDTEFYEFTAAEPVPEPGTLLLLGSGLAAATLRRRRRA